MKKNISFISLLLSLNFSAQVDSVLFGLATTVSGPSISPTSNIYLTRVNTITGVLTNAANSATTGGIQVGNSTIDSYNKVFYYMKNGTTMIGISLYNGSVVSSNTLTMPIPGYLHNMYFNCGDTTIYALYRTTSTSTNPASSSLYLAKVNPNTGVVTSISPSSIGSSVQFNNVTIDPYNKIYYYFTQNTIVGLSLISGNVVSSATMSVPSSTIAFNYSGVFYNRSDSLLYGLARSPATVSNTPSSASIYLAKFSPNGVVSIISPTSVAYSMQVANSGIDPYQKIYYFVNGSQQLLGISLLTGLTVTSPTISNVAGGSFLEMNYNCNYCPLPKQDFITGITGDYANDGTLLYPNPVNTTLFVKLASKQTYQLEVRDLAGRLLMKQEGQQTDRLELDLSNLEKGMYTLHVFNSIQKIACEKFVISN